MLFRTDGHECGFPLWRYSALTRRYADLFHGIVNCAPARRYVWPVAVPAQAWVRAGGWTARRCVPVAATRVASPERGGVAVSDGGGSLRVAFCARSRLSCGSIAAYCARSRRLMRFYWNVLRQITPVSFPLSGKERRLAGCCVPIPPWVGIAISAFSYVVRLSDLFGSLRTCAFFCGDPDGVRRDTGNGVGGAA